MGEDDIVDYKRRFFPVGTLVTPKNNRRIRSEAYTAGKVYEVIETDSSWNYIVGNDGIPIGVAGWALKEAVHSMQAAEEYDEIIAAQTLMER